MMTTMKISKETKEMLMALDLVEKGKTFDMIINDLITYYQRVNKKYIKDYKKWEKVTKEWEKSMEFHKKEVQKYDEKKEVWDNLLKWAKSKGFKP